MEFCYVYVLFPSSRNLFNPLLTFEAAQAPEGFDDVVGFKGNVNPEG